MIFYFFIFYAVGVSYTEKVAFFCKTMTFFLEKKNNIDFSKKVPKASRDALCMGNTLKASLTLFAWDAPREALLGS